MIGHGLKVSMECGSGREKAEEWDALAEGEEVQLLGRGGGGFCE
jgi:hypothetical protein